jgi:hypothetical protein
MSIILSKVLRCFTPGRLSFMCPGCNERHIVNIDTGPGPRWDYNQQPASPTFFPSILVTWNEPSDVEGEFDDESKDKKHICHSYVTEGRIKFLSDCTHALAGQDVPLPEWEE